MLGFCVKFQAFFGTVFKKELEQKIQELLKCLYRKHVKCNRNNFEFDVLDMDAICWIQKGL
jgi:hypothetical protein